VIKTLDVLSRPIVPWPWARAALRQLLYTLLIRASDDLEREFAVVARRCLPYTMTSPWRLYALWSATRYVVRNQIPGAIVLCGVWRGGGAMLVAYALRQLGVQDRTLYLYDTFAGMPEPDNVDISHTGAAAAAYWQKVRRGAFSDWCYASLEDVRRNLARTRYPDDRLVFVQGLVEETIPAVAPDTIALMYLDTDWYQSTLHELTHLYPRLATGGVAIIDDYGYWQGARKAVDEYFAAQGCFPLLHRIDDTGRLIVKTGGPQR